MSSINIFGSSPELVQKATKIEVGFLMKFDKTSLEFKQYALTGKD